MLSFPSARIKMASVQKYSKGILDSSGISHIFNKVAQFDNFTIQDGRVPLYGTIKLFSPWDMGLWEWNQLHLVQDIALYWATNSIPLILRLTWFLCGECQVRISRGRLTRSTMAPTSCRCRFCPSRRTKRGWLGWRPLTDCVKQRLRLRVFIRRMWCALRPGMYGMSK